MVNYPGLPRAFLQIAHQAKNMVLPPQVPWSSHLIDVGPLQSLPVSATWGSVNLPSFPELPSVSEKAGILLVMYFKCPKPVIPGSCVHIPWTSGKPWHLYPFTLVFAKGQDPSHFHWWLFSGNVWLGKDWEIGFLNSCIGDAILSLNISEFPLSVYCTQSAMAPKEMGE